MQIRCYGKLIHLPGLLIELPADDLGFIIVLFLPNNKITRKKKDMLMVLADYVIM